MVYVDTSALIKLYIREEHSKSTSDWLTGNNEAIPLTSFHDLEFFNALHLKQYRSEILSDEITRIIFKFNEHESKGVYYRPQFNWSDNFERAINLSKKYTINTGSRSLDILHVASALSINAERFLTFDERQSKLASATGLVVERCD